MYIFAAFLMELLFWLLLSSTSIITISTFTPEKPVL